MIKNMSNITDKTIILAIFSVWDKLVEFHQAQTTSETAKPSKVHKSSPSPAPKPPIILLSFTFCIDNKLQPWLIDVEEPRKKCFLGKWVFSKHKFMQDKYNIMSDIMKCFQNRRTMQEGIIDQFRK